MPDYARLRSLTARQIVSALVDAATEVEGLPVFTPATPEHAVKVPLPKGDLAGC